MRGVFLLVCLLCPGLVWADTVAVSPGGDDTSACTMAAPCRTLEGASRRLAPGDTLLLAAGTYTEVLDRLLPSAVTVRGAAGVRPLLRPTSRGVPLFRLDTTQGITLEGFDVDLAACPACSLTGGWHVTRLTLRDLTIRGLTVEASQPSVGGCAICSWSTEDTDWLIERVRITDVAITGQYEKLIHGMYLHGRRMIVRNSQVAMGGNGGFAVHLYKTPDDSLIEGNVLSDSHGGIYVGGARTRIIGNTLRGHGHFALWGVQPPGAIVLGRTAQGSMVEGNTITAHQGPCIRVKTGSSTVRGNTCNSAASGPEPGEEPEPEDPSLEGVEGSASPVPRTLGVAP